MGPLNKVIVRFSWFFGNLLKQFECLHVAQLYFTVNVH